jgi:hypothetical protein
MAVTDAPRDEAMPPAFEGEDPPDGGSGSRLPSWMPAERLVSILVVAAAVVFTFWQLHPSKLLASTTPAGGDMGAHVWAPAYLRDHLLPSLRFTGWTPDWYAGFPAFHYYMVLPSLAIVLLDVVLPYGVAFKLVSISGLLALPVALYLFGRLARLPFPGPALLAAMAVPFLFDRSFSIYGGNVPSTLAGEFAFSISLAFCVVFLGVVLRGLETGRHRGLAALLLGLTVLCHLIPAIFALIGAGVAFALRPGRGLRAWWLVCVGAVGSLLAAWWALPFWWQRHYMNDMGWEKLEEYWENIFPGDIGQAISRIVGGAANNGNRGALPGDLTWIIVFAVVGFGLSIVLRRRPGTYIGVLAIVTAVAFRLAPQSRFWNARLLPFLYLCLFMLAAIAVLEIVNAISVLVAKDTKRPSRTTLIVAPAVACVFALAFMGLGLRSLPFGHTNAEDGTYEWLAFKTTDNSYIGSWADWNYSGYEKKPAAPEYFSVISAMRELGDDPEHGCGRAMWEYEKELDRFGTPMALMLLPYYTDSCIGSMEGLYFEASTTTPYHFLNQSELSTAPSNAQRDLRYQGLNVDLGVQHLQLMGVKYYMAFSEQAVAQAEGNEDLTEVATVPGERGDWHIYEVEDAPLVESATSLPAVVTDVPQGGRGWQDMAESWYLDPSQWDTLLASSGPDAWERITSGDEPEAREVEPVDVTNIEQGTSTISFDVSDVGTPVLVKTSYFPNWEVEGAEGPWRVAPNFMVVVPTSEHVELRYGRAPIEWFSWLLTFIGIALTVVLWRRPALVFPADVERSRRWRVRLERVDEPDTADGAPSSEIELEPEPRQ